MRTTLAWRLPVNGLPAPPWLLQPHNRAHGSCGHPSVLRGAAPTLS